MVAPAKLAKMSSPNVYRPPHVRAASPQTFLWEQLGLAHQAEARTVLSGPHMNKQGGSRNAKQQAEFLKNAQNDWDSGCRDGCAWLLRDFCRQPVAIVNIFRPNPTGAFVHRIYTTPKAIQSQSAIIKKSLEKFGEIHPEVRAVWAQASTTSAYVRGGFCEFLKTDMRRKNASASRKTNILFARVGA